MTAKITTIPQRAQVQSGNQLRSIVLFALSERIEQTLKDFLKILIWPNYAKHRQRLLVQAIC
jgi:hypothetical protein